MPENKITSVQEQVDTLRVRALSKLTDYLVVSAVFLFAAFLYRLTDTDWQDTYILQFIVFFLLMVTITIRDKLSYKTTIYCYLSLGFILAISEFISLGLSGMGEVASLFCIMLSLFYLDKKSTAVVSLIITVIFGVTFYEYLYAGRTLSENDIAYVSWHSAWIGRFTAHATFFLVLGVSILFLQDQIIRLLLELETQKQTIESQKEQIEHLANHDALTGLPSLRVADDRLEAALDLATQQNHKSALLFLDLESLCQRLILVISMPLTYKDIELAVGVSIGAASYPCSASSSRDLRLKADELMYQVKKSGKNNYRILMD